MGEVTSQRPLDTGRDLVGLLEVGGGALLFIAAYSPWVQTFALFATVSVRGIDTTYGRLLPLIPLVAFGLLAWRWYARRGRWVHLVIITLGILTMALTLAYAVEVRRNVTRAQQSLARSVGQVFPGTVRARFDVGIYLAVAGGAAMLAGGLLGIGQDRPMRKQE